VTAARLVLGAAALAALVSCVPVRYADCGGGTVRLADDPQHCGGCHVACPEGVPCVEGRCAIPEGATVCREWDAPPGEPQPWRRPEEATCGEGDPAFFREHGTFRCRIADLTTDPANCGTCGNACPVGAACSDGVCACEPDRIRCLVPREDDGDGETPPDLEREPWRWDEAVEDERLERRCVDPATDSAHCGGCNRRCPEGSSCVDGACRCPDGLTFCARESLPPEALGPPPTAGACAELTSWDIACGACGTACAANERCVDGRCVPCCESPP
jgi:hypothetical protein